MEAARIFLTIILQPTTLRDLEDQIFEEAAARFQNVKSQRRDDLLSNQMLVGIPEVELGLE